MKQITLKTSEIISLRNRLKPLTEPSRSFPGKVAYVLAKNNHNMNSALESYEELERNLLLKLKDEGKLLISESGQISILDPKDFSAYQEEIAGMGTVELDLSIVTLSQAEFESLLETHELSVPEIEALEFMTEVAP